MELWIWIITESNNAFFSALASSSDNFELLHIFFDSNFGLNIESAKNKKIMKNQKVKKYEKMCSM